MRRLALLTLTSLALMIAACGGGGGSGSLSPGSGGSGGGGGGGGGGQVIASPGPNVVTLVVDGGPAGLTSSVAVNTPYITITLCAPGTTNCQTIDHIEVDTGSYGLRIISSVINPSLLAAMPVEAAGGGSIAECTIFGDGYSWGSMRTADLQISSEKASGLPVQVIGDPNFANVPSACSSAGGTPENTVDQFGANGILGVGPFAQDCGTTCASGNTTPQFYYNCPTGGGTCTATAVALNQQATNPVSLFTTDNNGVILELPTLADAGALSVTNGALVFGIDTQSNNMSSGTTVLTTDTQVGYIKTVYKGKTYASSYIDSGSNLLYFNDSTLTTCTVGSGTNNTFFCPATETTLSATNEGANNAQSNVTFKVANAKTQFTVNPSFTAFNNIAAPALSGQSDTFDFGLPFYYGRNVFTAIEGKNTSGGMGPYFAY